MSGAFIKSDDSEIKNKILNSLTNRVEATSKGFQRLSLAMNLLLKDLMAEKTNPLEIVLPTFLLGLQDNTFSRQLMIGLERSNKPNEVLKKFFNRRGIIAPLTGIKRNTARYYDSSANYFIHSGYGAVSEYFN